MHIADHLHFGHWHPITTAPYNQAIELRVLDHGKVVALPFPCSRDNTDHWINSDLGTPIEIKPIEWRIWHRAAPQHSGQ